jgi:hypothetical protein
MPKSNDQQKRPAGAKLDRRAVIRGAFAVGGASVLARGAANSQGPVVAEREWARALARHVSNQLPEAARQIPDLCLTADQLEQLRKAFENTLVTNMGCESPPS